MMSPFEISPTYKQTKKNYFDKYDRKIDAIISNIDQSSLLTKDKQKLKNCLAAKLKCF